MSKRIFITKTINNIVNWDNTKSFIQQHSHIFCDSNQDFGIGVESSVLCPGCGRTLPLALFALDHIKPQSRYTKTNLGIVGNAGFVIIGEHGVELDDAKAQAFGGYVTITSGSIYNPKVGNTQSADIWKNDLSNLQFLCSICNSSKKDKNWNEWGKSDAEARPLHRKLKLLWSMFTD